MLLCSCSTSLENKINDDIIKTTVANFMVKYDPLDHKRYKKRDFESIGHVDKITLI